MNIVDLRGPIEFTGKFLPKADVEDFEFDTDSEDEHELADQPLGVLNLMGKHSILERERMNHHQLARASFVLGVALVDLNVNQNSGANDISKPNKIMSPLEHVRTAAYISNGASDFMAGVIHGFQDQFNGYMKNSQSNINSSSTLFNVISGFCSVGVHGFIYTSYVVFLPVLVAAKINAIANVNSKK